ncbi:uncharacterized protein TRIADDRAFT_25151 [Trichoplax adhaerens]|uniref:DNA helicase n=1 Tax=Trichoplax adhaerens TaxID=10228 RepID=B3RYG2_TRIAD|nr:hypothetical protein TRIADDRAFT_25151 [Trichoplax adhaerens]EDV25032.1 hypothetical protein TRIADDRAFT_25151 [Trichoplax adhaerens]|eukprot:XP_002112922.1 hypothetical protein TRIADDRAFT_25151 [Trichoplax adhaerens]
MVYRQSASDESDDTDDSEYDLIIHDRAVQVAILSFLNQASLSDLAFIENVSVNKARYICELRPFQSWTDVVEKFNQTRSLSDDILWNCGDLLKRRNILHKLLDKCEELAALVDSRSFKSEECVDKQPEILNNKYQLKSYQLVGLNWMLLLYKKGFNGILADEMGLGKTIQVIAFLSHLYQFGITGPHLIIVPSSTLDNWKRELKNWCPKLKVVLYYGSPEERFELRMDIARRTVKLHILLTTYHMCCTSPDDLQLFKKVKFTYAVFDEAHMLKNMMSKRYRALMRIRAQRKLLLTGTPLQNNLLELFSLLSFTMPDIFHDTKEYILNFFSTFKRKSNFSKQTDDKSTVPFVKGQIEQAKKIMKPFVLRRLKSEVMSQLPKKVQLKELCNMTERQEELYKKLMIKCSTAYNSSDTSKARKSILMDLRKMANHPSLHRIYYNDDMLREMAQIIVKEPSHHDANIEYVFEDMTVMNDFELHQLCNEFHVLSKYLMPQELLFDSGKIKCLDRLLPLMKERGDRVLLFSQFVMVLDIIECYIQYRGYSYLRMDGQTPIKDRLDLIDQFNDSEADKFIFLLSTKASGLGINLTSANVVILHDIDFNPHNDKQAEDRCHRVGQDKDVIVYRLICPDTIDQTMLQFCDNKLHLEKSVDGKESEKDNESMYTMFISYYLLISICTSK